MRQHGLPQGKRLLFAEGFAVGAGVHLGIRLVGAHQDPVQGAVVLPGAVVGAVLDGALDTSVCVHIDASLYDGDISSMPGETGAIQDFFPAELKKRRICAIVIKEEI